MSINHKTHVHSRYFLKKKKKIKISALSNINPLNLISLHNEEEALQVGIGNVNPIDLHLRRDTHRKSSPSRASHQRRFPLQPSSPLRQTTGDARSANCTVQPLNRLLHHHCPCVSTWEEKPSNRFLIHSRADCRRTRFEEFSSATLIKRQRQSFFRTPSHDPTSDEPRTTAAELSRGRNS
ncbi:starch branching enzyme 2.1 [Striga asiatica]|uniref:Starch branching enzyme 2.1 n=1 Tax=Striga asiatica TaxID=4170 RepID=A0A5A7PKC1_STRAF|nr:starch branching enzyme 2.1 [Striga asiatica]